MTRRSLRTCVALLAGVAATLTSALACAALPGAGTGNAGRKGTDGSAPVLQYVVRQPTVAVAHPPLLLLMHGYGSDENDMNAMAASLPPRFLVVSARAPYAAPDGGYMWYRNERNAGQPDGDSGQIDASMRAVLQLVPVLEARYGVNDQQVFIGGFSQGGSMSYEIALRTPHLFRGAVVMSGSIFPSLQVILAQHSAATDTPFFIGHGEADQRIPFPLATQASQFLTHAKVTFAFHGYPGMQHQVSDQEISDVDAWLTATANGTSPTPSVQN